MTNLRDFVTHWNAVRQLQVLDHAIYTEFYRLILIYTSLLLL